MYVCRKLNLSPSTLVGGVGGVFFAKNVTNLDYAYTFISHKVLVQMVIYF